MMDFSESSFCETLLESPLVSSTRLVLILSWVAYTYSTPFSRVTITWQDPAPSMLPTKAASLVSVLETNSSAEALAATCLSDFGVQKLDAKISPIPTRPTATMILVPFPPFRNAERRVSVPLPFSFSSMELFHPFRQSADWTMTSTSSRFSITCLATMASRMFCLSM